MAEDTVDRKDNPQKTEDLPEGGESTQEQLPERFKGKSAQDIAKAYTELERKLGQQSTEVGQTRQESEKAKQQLQQWEALGKVIQSNPALYYQIEGEIKKISAKQPSGEQQNTVIPAIQKDVTDSKLALQNQIFERFENKYGLDGLSKDEQDSLKQRVGKELMEMRGAKDVPAALAGIPLDTLPTFLDKAYRLATSSDDKERARLQGMVDARKNNQAAFGNIPSGSIRENTTELSPEEKKVAKRLGVSEDKYLKQKQYRQQN